MEVLFDCIHIGVDIMAIENLGIIKWLHENGVPWTKDTFARAVRNGDIKNMKWLHEKGCPWDEETFRETARHCDMKYVVTW